MGVQELFRRFISTNGIVILTNGDIKWIVRRVSSGNFTVKKVAQIYGVTERRVQQLTKIYRDMEGDSPR